MIGPLRDFPACFPFLYPFNSFSQASIIYSRGKARVGHEFKVTLTVSGEADGKIFIPCMDDISDGDWEMEYSVTKGSKSALKKSIDDELLAQYEKFMVREHKGHTGRKEPPCLISLFLGLLGIPRSSC